MSSGKEPDMERVKMPNDNKYSPSEKDNKHAKLKAKRELFEKSPDEFVHIDSIVVAALKSKNGIGVMIGKCNRQEMELASVRIQYRVFSLFQQMEIQQMMAAEKNKIVTAPGAKPAGGIIT